MISINGSHVWCAMYSVFNQMQNQWYLIFTVIPRLAFVYCFVFQFSIPSPASYSGLRKSGVIIQHVIYNMCMHNAHRTIMSHQLGWSTSLQMELRSHIRNQFFFCSLFPVCKMRAIFNVVCFYASFWFAFLFFHNFVSLAFEIGKQLPHTPTEYKIYYNECDDDIDDNLI